MKTKVYLGIAIRIIALFMVGMLATYIPDELRGFFGDTLHDCSNHGKWCTEEFDVKWNWGSRHYWYAYMMVFLFLLSIVNVVVSVVNLLVKEYPNEF